MNTPNKLTIFRVILVPIMVIFSLINIPVDVLGVPLNFIIMDIIFIIASLTDKLDGYLARKNNEITNFGKFLDPIADKILVVSAMLILVGVGKLPAWIPIIIITREFAVSGYRLIAVEQNGKVIAASVWGKLKTVTQMIAIILAFVDVNGFGVIFTGNLSGGAFALNLASTILMIICLVATIFSGYDYLKGSKELFKDAKKSLK